MNRRHCMKTIAAGSLALVAPRVAHALRPRPPKCVGGMKSGYLVLDNKQAAEDLRARSWDVRFGRPKDVLNLDPITTFNSDGTQNTEINDPDVAVCKFVTTSPDKEAWNGLGRYLGKVACKQAFFWIWF